MTGDEYMTLLAQRRDAYEAAHPHHGPTWTRPLLDWFIQPGDEDLVTLPGTSAPRPRRPRTYRTSASLRAERDQLAAQAQRIFKAAGVPDRAASHGLALGQRRTARVQAATDRALARYTRMHERIAALDGRIARAERRERTTAPPHRPHHPHEGAAMTLGDAQVPPGTVHTTGANRGLTPGTPRPARVGETVSTAAELEALPVGAIVRGRSGMLSRGDGRFGPTWYHHPSRDHAADSATVAEVEGSMTVLFRPDAPQPVAENSAPAVLGYDDAVDRAARAAWEEAYDEDQRSYHPWDAPWVKQTWTDIARAALAAAGAGAEVDREGERLARDLWDAEMDACLTDIEEAGHTVDHDEDGTPIECVDECPACAAERLRALLAARGDAAAPAEVEWGVRWSPDTTEPYPSAEDACQAISADSSDAAVLVRRIVPAWREVEDGEQRV